MVSKRQRTSAPSCRPGVELLENRQLLSGWQPTAEEQLFLELLNDARADPAAYGAAIGVNLHGIAPAQPLAFNLQLTEAARRHSLDQSLRGYFDHITPEGLDPGLRLNLAGFIWTSYGESLAGGTVFSGPAEALAGLIIDRGVPNLGHRRHLLAIDAVFTDQNQVGIGIVRNGPGPLRNYYTINTASSLETRVFLTGVVFADGNGNGRYDVGEGLPGVTVSAGPAGSVTTFDSGGYSLPLPPGSYTVTASGGGLVTPLTHTVTVGRANVRVNFVTAPAAFSLELADQHVRKLYLAELGRPASEAEVAAWRPLMARAEGPAWVANLIGRSREARTRLVQNWYQTYLGRPAVAGEEQGWVALLIAGATEEDVLSGIVGSQEYLNRVAAPQTAVDPNVGFLQAMFWTFLKRAASDLEINLFLTHVLPGRSRAEVARLIFSSLEYRAAVVRSFYTDLLNRPTPPRGDEVNAWVASGLDLTSIRCGFRGSREFAVNG